MSVDRFFAKPFDSLNTELGNASQRQSGAGRRDGIPPIDPRDAGK